MNVYFDSEKTSNEPLRELAIQRVLAARRRLSQAASVTKVKITDLFTRAGPKDKQCRVEIKVSEGGTVIAIARGSDWRAALESALARAARLLPRFKRRARIRSHHARNDSLLTQNPVNAAAANATELTANAPEDRARRWKSPAGSLPAKNHRG